MTIDNNFTFDDRHCLTDYGLIYVPAATRALIAPRSVVSYTIDGVSGTQAFGDDNTAQEYQETGVLYYVGDLPSDTEARALWRRIAAWLTAGRRQLTWDSEPDRYVVAEVQQLHQGKYGWLDGGLQVTWLIQPYTWDRQLQKQQITLTSASPSGLSVLHVDTGRPTPLTITAVVGGSANLTELEILLGSKIVRLAGMSCKPGETLQIRMDQPIIGAEITDSAGGVVSAMQYMEALDFLEVSAGGAAVHVSAAFSSSGGSAEVTIAARGCWE